MSRDFDAFTNRVNSTLLDLIKQKQAGISSGDSARQAFQEKSQQLAMQQQKQLGYDAMDARHNALYEKLEQDTELQKVFQGDMMPEQYAMKYGVAIPGSTTARGSSNSSVTPYQVQQALQSEYENLPLGSPEKAAGMGAYADSRRAALSKAMGESSATDVPLEDKIAAFQKRKAEEDAVELINYNLNRVNEYRDSKGNKVDKSTPGAIRYLALAGAKRELPSTVLAGLNKGADVPSTDTAKEGTDVPSTDTAKEGTAKASTAPATAPAAQDKPMSYTTAPMGLDVPYSKPTGPPAYTSAPMGLDVPYSKPPEAKVVLPTRGPSAALRRATVPAVEPEKSVAKEETWQRRMYKPQPQSQPEVKRNRKVTQSYDELQKIIEDQKRLYRR
jgi:hypothetical protein